MLLEERALRMINVSTAMAKREIVRQSSVRPRTTIAMRIPKVVGFFTSLGIPLPAFNAYFVSSLEFVGGALLFLGLGSRIIALPLTIDMLVAYITADREALFSIFSDPGKFYASDAYFLFASVLILIFGPGKISVDYAIGYLWRRRAPRPQNLREKSALVA
jgi:uncharacterized membrane protein YphA (DoxX/SURF4 family)